VLSPFWVFLALGERPSGTTLAGGALILLALTVRYTVFAERAAVS
jgi:drug/metabolite transporter (DMT)-like permease